MQKAIFVLFSPFHLQDPVQEPNDLCHATEQDEGVHPSHSLIPQENAQFV